jgi:putative oxidoreductase
VRRLFSNFASGWPSLGLLLIRIVAGTTLIIDAVMKVHAGQLVLPMLLSILAIGDGTMLIVGLWTPLAGILAGAISIVEIVFLHQSPRPEILLAAMGVGLALVGPGALSIDAWIFGLKKIDLEKLEGPSH